MKTLKLGLLVWKCRKGMSKDNKWRLLRAIFMSKKTFGAKCLFRFDFIQNLQFWPENLNKGELQVKLTLSLYICYLCKDIFCCWHSLVYSSLYSFNFIYTTFAFFLNVLSYCWWVPLEICFVQCRMATFWKKNNFSSFDLTSGKYFCTQNTVFHNKFYLLFQRYLQFYQYWCTDAHDLLRFALFLKFVFSRFANPSKRQTKT